MTVLIDQEARHKAKAPSDIERYGNRFKTDNDYFIFPDPNLETIDKNLYYLLRQSKEIQFEQKYKYKPEYLSFDEYGTTAFWEILLYVNGVYSVEDFDLSTVIIPAKESIVFIMRDLFPEKPVSDLQGVNW
jgi:hypothetical protein